VDLERSGRVVVSDVRWDKDLLTARIQQERLCFKATRTESRHQRVLERSTTNVALDILVGALLTGGGGAALGLSQQFSDQKDPGASENSFTPRSYAYLFGGIGALGGAIWLGHGIYRAAQSADQRDGEPWTSTDDLNPGPRSRCGYEDAPAGMLRFSYGGEVVSTTPFRGSSLQVDLRAAAAQVCSVESRIGTSLRIAYVPKSIRGAAEEVEISTHSADACIRSYVASTLLDHAAQRGSSTSSNEERVAELSELGALLGRAKAMIAALSQCRQPSFGVAGRLSLAAATPQHDSSFKHDFTQHGQQRNSRAGRQ
jgi:hypothetical protein